MTAPRSRCRVRRVDKVDDIVTILRKIVASATGATAKRGPENG